MKKITIVMLLVMLGGINTLFAQSQGDMYVGTMLGMYVSKHSDKVGDNKSEDKPYVKLEIDPGFHYFVADNFRIGIQTKLGLETQKYDNDRKYTNSAFWAGAVAAYYFEIADKLYFTPEVGFYFAHSKHTDKVGNNSTESKANGFVFQLLPAMLEFRPTTHFGFSASVLGLELTHMKGKDSNVKSNDFAFALGLAPQIGFKYYF